MRFRSIYQKRNGLVLTLLIVFSFSMFKIEKNNPEIRSIMFYQIQWVLMPFLYTANFSLNWVLEHQRKLIYLNEEIQKNQELQKKLMQLNSLMTDNTSLILENQQLKQQLNYQNKLKRIPLIPEDNIIAEIIFKATPSSNQKILLINKGRQHDIETNMPVLAFQEIQEDGIIRLEKIVVGKVVQTGHWISQVALITSASCVLHAKIKQLPVSGFIENAADDKLQLKYLDKNTLFRKNHTVITTGGQSLFPFGIKIGTVEKDLSIESSPTKTFLVKPYLNFSTLKHVFVLKNKFSKEIKTLITKNGSN